MDDPLDLARVRQSLLGVAPSALERPRRAAVALVLSGETERLELLLVRRTERSSDPWSGHMALPGGHSQPEDIDLLATARRETWEEVGVDLGPAEVLGQLDDIAPMRSSDISVRPFVFWLRETGKLVLSEEVAESLWVPLGALVEDRLRATHVVQWGGLSTVVPAFVVDERVIWGMTFRVLETFVARILRVG